MNEQHNGLVESQSIQEIDLFRQVFGHFSDVITSIASDPKLLLAILLTWAIVHGFKQNPWLLSVKSVPKRRWLVRMFSVVIGICCVLLYKRDLGADTVNMAIFIGFVHPFAYSGFTAVLERVSPGMASKLKSKKR